MVTINEQESGNTDPRIWEDQSTENTGTKNSPKRTRLENA
jgi:hypothetical protein